MRAHARHRGLTALAAGTALSLGALCALATGAAANATSIDTSQQGRIIIHKYENPDDGDQNAAGTGTNPSTAPVAGVVFEYCTVSGIDLFDGSNRGWDAVNAITAAEKQAAAAQGVTQLGSRALSACTLLPATDASGLAASPTLPLGVYFVREVSTPANVVTPAAPFVVTLPTPADHRKLDGDWVYDVNLYPKNTVAQGPAKNIVDQPGNGVILGAPVTYQVTQLIPALATGQTYDSFVVSDTLDPKLSPATAVAVTVMAGTTSFDAATDYVAAWTGQKLTVTFTAAGRQKLRAGMNVVLAFQATVTSPGEIENQAFVELNDLSLTPGAANGPGGSPSSTVVSRWGDLTVRKVDQAKDSDGLAGAKFHIYLGTTDQPSSCTADITGLQQVTTAGTATPYVVTSDGSGTVVVPGLWIGDTEKTVAADGTVSDTTVGGHDLRQRCYVLEEIAAPNGFVLPTGAAALTPVMVKAGANGTVPLVTIPNTQQGVPQLPFTGSSVQLAMTIGGIALVVVALGGVLVIRRRNARRESA